MTGKAASKRSISAGGLVPMPRRSSHVRRLVNVSDRVRQHRKPGQKVEVKLTQVKNSTIRRDLTTVMSILNWSAARRPPLIPFNPVTGYKLPKVKTPNIPPPTVAEVQALLAVACDHLKRFILLCYYIGARPGPVEILSITWDQVNFETRTILMEYGT
jgi:integrase